ncbi:hypothetical protein [Streptomyces sp. NRRL F-5123]|uniref:hypothetical protein n=1 Tax=Streptomyces sp. NRRL F-5123 TaxID=1463856 RepID=UPI0004E25742|nr:hypothetical protein [Streptomyces sp. NRRL F-5123]
MTLDFEIDWDEIPEERPIVFPGKRPGGELPHVLVVEEHPDDGFTVEHMHDCLDQWGEVACDVAFNEDWVGLDEFFHRADVEAGEKATDGLIPGRYWVAAWSSEYYCYSYGTTEYDHGVALLYPEEAE